MPCNFSMSLSIGSPVNEPASFACFIAALSLPGNNLCANIAAFIDAPSGLPSFANCSAKSFSPPPREVISTSCAPNSFTALRPVSPIASLALCSISWYSLSACTFSIIDSDEAFRCSINFSSASAPTSAPPTASPPAPPVSAPCANSIACISCRNPPTRAACDQPACVCSCMAFCAMSPAAACSRTAAVARCSAAVLASCAAVCALVADVISTAVFAILSDSASSTFTA